MSGTIDLIEPALLLLGTALAVIGTLGLLITDDGDDRALAGSAIVGMLLMAVGAALLVLA